VPTHSDGAARLILTGARHILHASLTGNRLLVMADGAGSWEFSLPPEAFAFDGRVGIRSHNGRLVVELRASAPLDTRSRKQPRDERVRPRRHAGRSRLSPRIGRPCHQAGRGWRPSEPRIRHAQRGVPWYGDVDRSKVQGDCGYACLSDRRTGRFMRLWVGRWSLELSQLALEPRYGFHG
jgi:hypothetical protein